METLNNLPEQAKNFLIIEGFILNLILICLVIVLVYLKIKLHQENKKLMNTQQFKDFHKNSQP